MLKLCKYEVFFIALVIFYSVKFMVFSAKYIYSLKNEIYLFILLENYNRKSLLKNCAQRMRLKNEIINKS